MSTLAPRAELAPVQPSVWQKPFVQDVLPFLSSMAFHLSLLALGLLTYKVVTVVAYRPSVPPIDVGATHIPPGDYDPNNLYRQLGVLNGTDLKPEQNSIPDAPEDSPGLGVTKEMSLTATIASLTAPGGSAGGEDGTIAVGPNKNGFGRAGNGAGLGEGDGTGTGDPVGLAPFGPNNNRPLGTLFVNCRGYARRVVFLCDSSGSMINKLDPLRVELRKAISQLKPIQSFDVIFFADDGFKALDPQLLMATPENKRKAYEFLDQISSRGSSDPIPGLRAAFAAGPQLIYMLTDGDFPNNGQVIEEIRRLDPANAQTGRKPVILNTIAFMDRGEEYEKLLQQIARETGGIFRFVADTDLQR